MTEPYATRREVEILKAAADAERAEIRRRLDELDAIGPRGLVVLQVQVTDLAKEVQSVKGLVNAHDRVHEREAADRRSGRWRLAGLIVAAVAAVDGPLVTLLLARGR